MLTETFLTVLQMLLYIFIAPGVVGTLRSTKARLQGRQGPRLYQPYLDLWKLFRKRPVIPEASSWVFVSAPVLVFLCYAFLGLLVPLVYLPKSQSILEAGSLLSPPLADLLILVYVLGFTHFALGLAGLDSGSPFGGMGSGREMFINVISEPTLVIAIYALSLNAYSTSLPFIMQHEKTHLATMATNPSFWLVILALMLVVLIEAGRIPFDNPATNLELTKIGQNIHDEYSGPYLALLEWSDAMRLTFFITLLINLLLPFTLAASGQVWWQSLLLALSYFLKLGLFILALSVWELTRAKMRLQAIAGMGGVALAFSVLAVFAAVAMLYFV